MTRARVPAIVVLPAPPLPPTATFMAASCDHQGPSVSHVPCGKPGWLFDFTETPADRRPLQTYQRGGDEMRCEKVVPMIDQLSWSRARVCVIYLIAAGANRVSR